MARRTVLLLPALIVAALLLACAAVTLAVSKEAQATFPGKKNGKIAYVSGSSEEKIYVINPDGSGKTKVTQGYDPSFSSEGKKIAYANWDASSPMSDSEIYTINADGGGKFKVTDVGFAGYGSQISWGSRP
jgi:Tol biopolymer transport system component